MVNLCFDMCYMWWGDQELKLKEWEDYINTKKTTILANIMLVLNKNPSGYKEHAMMILCLPLEVLQSLIG